MLLARALAALCIALSLAGCMDPPSHVAFTPDYDNHRFVVHSLSGDVDWVHLHVSTSEPTLKVRVNGEATKGEFDAQARNAGVFVPLKSASTPLQITDFLDLCGEPFEFGVFTPIVRLVNNATKQEVASFEFFNVPRCA